MTHPLCGKRKSFLVVDIYYLIILSHAKLACNCQMILQLLSFKPSLAQHFASLTRWVSSPGTTREINLGIPCVFPSRGLCHRVG